MLKRALLPLFCKPQFCNKLLNTSKICCQRKQMSTIALPLQHLYFGNFNYPLVSSIVSYIFCFDLKFSDSVITNEIKKISELILPEDFEKFGEKRKEIQKILMYLFSKGYSSKEIREKFLVYLKSKDISYAKFNFLEEIDSNIELLLPLLSLSKSVLRLAAQNSKTDKLQVENFVNRIRYLSHHLDTEPKELIPTLARHSSLLTMNFKRLDNKMLILKNANISTKYIVQDLWIFNYKEELLASRIQASLKAKVDLKPWMLRCSEKIFQSILAKNAAAKDILGEENVNSYLAKRLDCSSDYVDYMMVRNKLLKTINIPKLNQILNFLYDKGYTPQEIRLFPRVFCSSVQSLEKRFKEFQSVKDTLPTVAQLCMSKKKSSSILKQVN